MNEWMNDKSMNDNWTNKWIIIRKIITLSVSLKLLAWYKCSTNQVDKINKWMNEWMMNSKSNLEAALCKGVA